MTDKRYSKGYRIDAHSRRRKNIEKQVFKMSVVRKEERAKTINEIWDKRSPIGKQLRAFIANETAKEIFKDIDNTFNGTIMNDNNTEPAHYSLGYKDYLALKKKYLPKEKAKP